MLQLQACIVCLSTNVKMSEMDAKGSTLRRDYNLLSGLRTAKGNGMPSHVCFQCAALLKKFSNFRNKCQRSHFALTEMLKRTKEITMHNIKSINRKAINTMPTLSFFETKKYHYAEFKFQWSQQRLRTAAPIVEMPLVSFSVGFVGDRIEPSSVEIQLLPPQRMPEQLMPQIKTEMEPEALQDKSEIPFEPIEESQGVYLDDHGEDYHDDYDNANYENENEEPLDLIEPKEENDVDGLVLDLEYAMLIPLSKKEARAAFMVSNMFYKGNYKCEVCSISCPSEDKLKNHARMHDRHFSGNFVCDICDNHYKTDFLLQTHHTDKHAFKYVCQKCSEVSFDRRTAKHHFVNAHGELDRKGKLVRPDWFPTKRKGFNKKKSQYKTHRKRLGSDFPKRTAVPQPEQYRMVQARRDTRNYKESPFKCELCFKGFRETATYEMHMKKHDPAISGPLQCDMCKMRAHSARGMYRHVNLSHLFKYNCRLCDYECYSRGQATSHYHSHQNVTYSCPHCPLVFKKLTTKMTHVRIKHPSSHICSICGHTFVSQAGLYFHKRKTHTPEDISASAAAADGAGGGALYCAECRVQFLNSAAFSTHLGSSSKHANVNWSCKQSGAEAAKRKRLSYKGAAAGAGAGAGASAAEAANKRKRRARAASEILHNGQATESPCEVCGEVLKNDVQTLRHYRDAHPGVEVPKRYMCDQCGHKTKQYANLVSHMRVHTNEKPYSCPHCERKFSMPSNRDRHLVVHTGEKPYECKLCFRRFSQSTAVKLHVQTVHLKIPYKPWDKKNRKRRKEMESQMPATEPKLMLDTAENYINAYISYNE